MKLWAKILIAIVLGVITGFVLGPHTQYLKPIGTIFLNMLKMLIVPLMFSSMISGITHITDTRKLGRVGFTAIALYLVTTLMAIAFGIFVVDFFGFGKELHLPIPDLFTAQEVPTIGSMLESIIPKNPIQAFAEGNVLQIIVFAVFFGFALILSGDKGKPLISVIDSLASVMLRLTSIVMAFSPIGVFALMAHTAGTFGLDGLLPVMKFLIGYWIAAIVFVVVVVSVLLRYMAKLSPIVFFKNMTSVIATAASTCSTSAALPLTMQVAQERLGISKPLTNFILPLGCTLNMNGSALFQSMSAIFIAQGYGIELHAQHIVALVTTVCMASLGTASVPGGGLLMLTIVFSAIGIPLEAIALLAGIDRLRDMVTTPMNIVADAAYTVFVAKRENELDTEIYYQGIKAPIQAKKQSVI